MAVIHKTGEEHFQDGDRQTELTVLDFWRFEYSNLLNQQDRIAEYLVAKSLGRTQADNANHWSLYDIDYKGRRIEVKQTAYMHPWNDNGKVSKQRVFNIGMAYTGYKNPTTEWKRQSDLYIFCLNTGMTREDADPLNLEHWEFYVIPTAVINSQCGGNKTISLNRVRKIAGIPCKWKELRQRVDSAL